VQLTSTFISIQFRAAEGIRESVRIVAMENEIVVCDDGEEKWKKSTTTSSFGIVLNHNSPLALLLLAIHLWH
jgi:hypothetical protein